MGYLGQSLEAKGSMKRKQCSSSSPTKIERKTIEKNRRDQMKNLYSTLKSLLPNQPSKEALSLPDQVDEAINYIKMLETKLKECKKKKESLQGRERSHACISDGTEARLMTSSSPKAPEIEIHEMGSNLEVILTSGVDDQFIFYEVIRILHQDGAEILNANFSVVGNTIFHVIHAEIRDSMFGFGAAKISERLKGFVSGCASEGEMQLPELWDFEINPELWEF
ncbi:hypothetical protein AB3S75_006765 [Citrus x aurantiifolia]